jgi:UDP-3-O-[3-hydroxymyristoyl] N-acetylglucosamine deacetylase
MYCFFTIFAFCQVPLLDGSAREWVQAIEESGLVVASNSEGLPVDREVLVIEEPITSIQGDSFIAAFPAPSTRLTYGIDFPQVPAIGTQWFTWIPEGPASYKHEVAPARTFGIYEQVGFIPISCYKRCKENCSQEKEN